MISEQNTDLAPETAGGFKIRELAVKYRAADAIEQLWASIFFSPERSAPKSIVVTSAEPREGTTQIASALALVGSSKDRGLAIALVDFNFRRPMLAKIFDIQSAPGVVEVLTGEVPLMSALCYADHRRLAILPAGRTDESSMSLPQGKDVAGLISKLAAKHDHVIIDTPSVNRYATVQTLAGVTDGTILVTKAGVTRREAIAEAKKRIELAKGRVIGMVLNQREFPIPGFLYRRF